MQILHAALRFMCMIIDFMSNLLQQTHKGDNTDFYQNIPWAKGNTMAHVSAEDFAYIWIWNWNVY